MQTTETAINRQRTFLVTFVKSGISYKCGSFLDYSVIADI